MQLVAVSNRLTGSLQKNEYAALLESKRAAGIPVLDLSCSNPTAVLEPYPHAEIAAALGSITDFSYAPDPFGARVAREAVAAQSHTSVDRVAFTASTSEAYSVLFKLLCDPGDEVLVPVPSYPLFEYLAALENVRVVPFPLHYDGAWHIDFDALRARITAATRAIVIVNPNNPTGSFLKAAEAERLLNVAAEHNLPLIADEVFQEYRWSDSPNIVPSVVGFDSHVSFSLGGLSKSAAMPQMKLGWMVLNGPESELNRLRPHLELILDTYLSVNTPVQAALPNLLAIGKTLRTQVASVVRANLDAIDRIFTSTPVHSLTTEGGWTAILQLPRIRKEQDWLTGLLEHASVVVQPGYFFDMPSEAYLVVSLITRPDIFECGLTRIREFVRSECARI